MTTAVSQFTDHEWKRIYSSISRIIKRRRFWWSSADIQDATQDALIRFMGLQQKKPEWPVAYLILGATKKELGYCGPYYRARSDHGTRGTRPHWESTASARGKKYLRTDGLVGVSDATIRASQGLPMVAENSRLLQEEPKEPVERTSNPAFRSRACDAYRQYQREWRKARIARMSPEERRANQDRTNANKRNWLARQKMQKAA